MALLDEVTVERWLAVAAVALEESARRGVSLVDVLSVMARLPGWPGRVAWLMLTDQSKHALVLEWLKSGVKPNKSLVEHVRLQLAGTQA